eukprot:CAMPEP_0171065012 /NCGR_PEP_ID=MMETSP0766_2-20121228/6609_1 /TAXON_ID=439317 /ORGANISM="Gambierdiscus australes, Strain CAWD 149" /LENGTH=728 /DNA_ID=CAMNT_0011521083 /DNA_START=74 /DNA_END=2260 /DNA_ORIENTATION=+
MTEGVELQTGIYVVDGEAVGSLAPKFRGMSYAFMVTSAIGRDSTIQMWCADLVAAGKVPDGNELAGHDVWALHGHPFGNSFVLVDGAMVECDKSWIQRYVWKHSDEFRGKLFREAAGPPISFKSFPSDNFAEAVINKNPQLNEPYSPSTQTIVEACAYFSKSLSTDAKERQVELVRLYTAETPLYHEMNQALRDDCLDKMRYFGAYIKELRDVFKTDHEDQIITPFEGTVWRGIKFQDIEAAMKEYVPGSVFVWPAFTSMSTAKSAAMGFGNLVFEIVCCPPPGHYDDEHPEYAPASVQEWSCYPSEQEILFPPNVKFKVQHIVEPNDENGFISPLVVCETVGFDTDGGIVEFSKMKEDEERRERQVHDVAQLDSLLSEHREAIAGLEARLEGQAEEIAQLRTQLAEKADACEVAELRDLVKREVTARRATESTLATLGAQVQELKQRQEQQESKPEGLGASQRLGDLQIKVLELSNSMSTQHNALQRQFGQLQTENTKTQSALEYDILQLSQKVQGILAESHKGQKSLEREMSRLSLQVQEQLNVDLRRAQELDQVLKGLTDKCYMTNMVLATEKLKYETLEIKSLLASEPKRVHTNASRRATSVSAPSNPRANLDAAVQGISEIRDALEALRHYLPSREGQLSFANDGPLSASQQSLHQQHAWIATQLDTTTEPAAPSTPPLSEGLGHSASDHGGGLLGGSGGPAVGGALQAARAARRPLPCDTVF